MPRATEDGVRVIGGMSRLLTVGAAALLLIGQVGLVAPAIAAPQKNGSGSVEQSRSEHNDVSPPLRDIPPAPRSNARREVPWRKVPQAGVGRDAATPGSGS